MSPCVLYGRQAWSFCVLSEPPDTWRSCQAVVATAPTSSYDTSAGKSSGHGDEQPERGARFSAVSVCLLDQSESSLQTVHTRSRMVAAFFLAPAYCRSPASRVFSREASSVLDRQPWIFDRQPWTLAWMPDSYPWMLGSARQNLL